VLLREHLTLLAVAGIVATVAGVMVAVLRGGDQGAGVSEASGVSGADGTGGVGGVGGVGGASVKAIGVVFGLAAALFYGIGGFIVGRYTADLGWLVPVIVARGGAMVLLLTLLATPLRATDDTRLMPGLAWAVAAGVFDAIGQLCFTRGDQVGLVAVTGAVSSAYPVIPLIGGLFLFRERLRRQQVGGALLILAGLVLLGIGS
jgi:drug/metabolite transporter (DMT)-like permease